MFRIHAVPYDHPQVAGLVERVQEFYVERYGEPESAPFDPAAFAPPVGHFLLGTVDGAAVACGGWRAHPAPSGDAEIKRMFVVPEARGRGYSRLVLAELERTAAAAGRTRMILETGTVQPEAIGLYVTSGYHEIDQFGYYRGHPLSCCYAKELTA